jgi:hypothetical protein
VAILVLRDGEAWRTVVFRYIGISPSEQPDVQVATRNVAKAVGERSLILSGVVFHGDDVVAHAAQLLIDSLPVVLEIFKGRRDVDPGHHPSLREGSQ